MTSACIQVGVAIFISVSASQTLVFNPRPANDALSAAVAIRRRKVRATRDPRHHPATPPIRGITGDDCAHHGTIPVSRDAALSLSPVLYSCSSDNYSALCAAAVPIRAALGRALAVPDMPCLCSCSFD